MVVIEAFAAGVPVLVDRGGNIRLGEGSVLFDADRVTEMLEELLFGETDKLEQISEAARNNALRCYSWDKIAADHAEVFLNEMKKHG